MGVVVEHPFVYELAHVGQRAKQVGVEQLAVKRAVEAFDVRILRRLTGLNPVQGNTLLLTPLTQFGASKFRAIVGVQLRGAALALNISASAPARRDWQARGNSFPRPATRGYSCQIR